MRSRDDSLALPPAAGAPLGRRGHPSWGKQRTHATAADSENAEGLMSGRTHPRMPQAITQNRLPSGSARTMKSASSGYSQSTLRAPREINRSTWAC
jgi:hypothetical protein